MGSGHGEFAVGQKSACGQRKPTSGKPHDAITRRRTSTTGSTLTGVPICSERFQQRVSGHAPIVSAIITTCFPVLFHLSCLFACDPMSFVCSTKKKMDSLANYVFWSMGNAQKKAEPASCQGLLSAHRTPGIVESHAKARRRRTSTALRQRMRPPWTWTKGAATIHRQPWTKQAKGPGTNWCIDLRHHLRAVRTA